MIVCVIKININKHYIYSITERARLIFQLLKCYYIQEVFFKMVGTYIRMYSSMYDKSPSHLHMGSYTCLKCTKIIFSILSDPSIPHPFHRTILSPLYHCYTGSSPSNTLHAPHQFSSCEFWLIMKITCATLVK